MAESSKAICGESEISMNDVNIKVRSSAVNSDLCVNNCNSVQCDDVIKDVYKKFQYETYIPDEYQIVGSLKSMLFYYICGHVDLTKEMKRERDFLFHLSKIECNPEENDTHFQMLNDICRFLLNKTFDVFERSDDWIKVGFQSQHPSTDFRSTGLLGLVCLHYFSTKNPNEFLDLFEISQIPSCSFPLCVVGINLTAILLSIVNTPKLIKVFVERNSLLDSFFRLYCIMFLQFRELWLKESLTIIKSNNVFDRLKDNFASKASWYLDFYADQASNKSTKDHESDQLIL